MRVVVVKRKPEWVPDEAWVDYQASLSYLERVDIEGGDSFRKKLTDIFSKLLKETDCKSLWRLIYGRTAMTSPSPVRGSRPSSLMAFLAELQNALAGPPRDAFFSSSERKARGERIAKHAKALDAELRLLGSAPPAEIGRPIADCLHEAFEAHAVSEYWQDGDRYQDELNRMQASLAARKLFFQDSKTILEIIGDSAERWAATKPYAHHSGDRARIKRDYFIRKMTAYCCATFGTPQRGLVVALTACLLNSVVTNRDVIRIAPSASKKEKPPAQTPEKARSSRTA